MKKRLLSLLLVGVLSVSTMLAGCSNSESTNGETEGTEESVEADGTLVIPILSDISNFYTVATGDITGDVLSANFDNLYTVKDDKTVDYYVAKSCDVSDDGLVYTIVLNEGIKWHDGEDLTAEDLVYTINNLDVWQYLPIFAGGPVVAEQVDDYTVTVTLEKPSNGFFQRLGTTRIMPKHLYEGVPAEEIVGCEASMQGIGMGPYKLVEWKQGESIEFERFDDYYRGTPPYEKIIYKVMPETSAQQVAFDKGEIDVLRITDITNLEKYREDERCNILELTENRVSMLVVSPSSANITSMEQKQAIFAAINHQEIIDQVFGTEDLAKAAGGIYVAGTKYLDKTLENYEFDLEKATELAKSSGLTEKTINLYYSTDRASMEDVAMVIQQQLKAAGITCELIGTEALAWAMKWQTGDSSLDMCLNGWDNMQGDPGFEWAVYGDGSAKAYMGFSDETLEILNLANTSLTEEDLEKNWQAFQLSSKEDYWANPLIDTSYILAIKKGNATFDVEQPSTFFFEDYIKIVE